MQQVKGTKVPGCNHVDFTRQSSQQDVGPHVLHACPIFVRHAHLTRTTVLHAPLQHTTRSTLAYECHSIEYSKEQVAPPVIGITPRALHCVSFTFIPAILGLEKKQKSRWKWRGCKRGSRVLPGDKETGGTSMVNHILHHLQRHME